MKYLYLPIVKMQRELDAKLLLSLEVLSNCGWKVVLCTVGWIKNNYNKVPPGAINWGTSKTGVEYIKKFKLSGHKVFAFCEEGVVWDERVYKARKLDADALRELDVFFAWGDVHADLAKEIQPDSNIVVSGNPRFDLLLESNRGVYADEVSSVVRKYGDYILILSRGSNFNDRESLKRQHENRNRTYTDGIDWLSYYKNLSDNWYEIASLAIRLASEYPAKTILFRPKFNEPRNFIDEFFKDAPSNLKIEGGGNVHPLIIGARAVISRHCTTMVEAELVGKPNVCFDPKPWDGFSVRISQECFPHLGSYEEVNNKLKKILHGSDAGNASIKSLRNFALAFESVPSCPIVAKWLEENIADAPEQEQLNLQVNTLAQQFRDILYQLYRLKKEGLSFEEGFDQKSIKNRWGKMVDSFGAPAGELVVCGSRDAIAIG